MGRDDLVTSNGDGGPILRFAKRYAVAAAGALYAFTLGVGDARNRRLIQQLATQFGHRDGLRLMHLQGPRINGDRKLVFKTSTASKPDARQVRLCAAPSSFFPALRLLWPGFRHKHGTPG